MKTLTLLISFAWLTINLANAQNLLINGDFNLPSSAGAPTGWNLWTYAATSGNAWANRANDSSSYDGSYYMQLGGDEGITSGAGLYQIVPGLPGYSYTLSVQSGVQAWWWPEGEMRMYFLDASGNALSESVSDITTAITANDTGLPWKNYTLTAVSPPGTASVKVEFASESYSDSYGVAYAGTVWFDNAVLTNAPSAAAYIPPMRIMPLGDSLTWGQSAPTNCPGGYRLPLYQLLTGQGYNAQMVGTVWANGAPNLPQEFHEGWKGYRIDQISSGFLSWVNTGPAPDVFLLWIGANDYIQSYNTSTATNRLDQLITLIATNQPNAKLVVANYYQTGNASVNAAMQSSFNPYVAGIVAAHAALGQQVYFIDMSTVVDSSDVSSDGLHLNQSGYNKVGTNWFNTVTNLIGPLGTTNRPAICKVAGGSNLRSVTVTFSKPVSTTATTLSNYSLNGGLTISQASLEPSAQRDVTLTTSAQASGQLYTLTVNNVQDATSSHAAIAAGSTAQFVSASPTLLANGDFSLPNATTAPNNWTTWTSGSANAYANHQAFTPPVVVKGNCDSTYQMVCGSTDTIGSAGAYQIVPATAGMTYLLSCDAGVQNWYMPAGQLRLFFLDSNNNTLATNLISTTGSIHNSSNGGLGDKYDVGVPYQHWSLSALAPAGTTQAKVEVYGAGGGSCWFDNVVLARVAQLSGTRTYDGTATTAASSLSVANNVDGADLTLSGSVTMAGKNAGSQAIVPPPTRVQYKTGWSGTAAATSFGVTLASAPANGNTLVAVISTRGASTGRVSSISQTGATWTSAAQAANTGGVTTEIWYAPGVSGARTNLTISLGASLFASAVVAEYSGILSASALDQTASNTGNSSTADTGTIASTAVPNELWIGGVGLTNSLYFMGSPNNAFNLIGAVQSASATSTANAQLYALERIVSATGAANSGGALSGYATIARRGTATTANNSGNSITIGLPTGVAAGDLMIAYIAQHNSSGTPSAATCSGWTAISSGYLGNVTTEYGTILYRIAGSSESSPSFTLAPTVGNAVGDILAFSGVDNTTPIDVQSSSWATSSGRTTAVSSTSVTTVTPNAAGIMFGLAANRNATGTATWNGWPSGLTEIDDHQGSGTFNTATSVGAAWANGVAAGTTGSGSATLSAALYNAGFWVVLRPAMVTPLTQPWAGAMAAFKGSGSSLLTLGGAAAGKYALSGSSGSVTVNPESLTYTANAASRAYGDANPALSGSVSGFVGGENQTDVTTGTPVFSSPASPSSPVGSYAISGSGLTANNGNYTLSQAAGNATALTITQATPAVTVTVGSYIYNGAAQGPNSYSTSPAGDTGAATWTYQGAGGTTYGPSATPPTAAGNYTAQVTLTADASFNAGSSGATPFTIAKSTLTPTVMLNNKSYDGTTDAATINTRALSGAIYNTDQVDLAGGTVGAFTSKNLGSYTPTVSGLSLAGGSAGNYQLSATTVSASASITAKALTVSGAAAQSKCYDGTNAAVLTGTLEGVVGSEDVTFIGTGTFASADAGTNIAVTSTSSLGGTQADNYGLTQPTGLSADINPLPSTSGITGSNSVNANQAGVAYSVTPTDGSTYVWSAPSGTTIHGQGSASITIDWSVTGGDASVTETDSSGCAGSPVSLAVSVVLNHPPSATDASYSRAPGLDIKISIAELIAAHVTDQDNDPITLQSLGSGTNAATIVADSGYILYTSANNDNPDVFTYTVSDGQGGTATANIYVAVVKGVGQAKAITVTGGVAVVDFAGIPGFAYDVQRSTDNMATWQIILTTNAPPLGMWRVTDDFGGNAPASAYYRPAQH